MRMEQISQHGLLEAYMKQNYADKEALVIFMDNIDSQQEFDSILDDLKVIGYLPPKNYLILGYLIIEMPAMLAKHVINNHNKGFIRMELYENGICTHENR